MRARAPLGLAVALVLALAACGSGGGNPAPRRTVTVLAAASLTEVFGRLEQRFEAEHPGVDVKISYGGSSDLAQQIVNGAPADVFAAANTSTMDTVARAGLAGQPRVFATNELRIAVPADNPKNIGSLADLAKDGVVLVVCAPQVPCGAATQKVATAAGVRLRPASEEPDVKSVLGKVVAGEADAGLVYVTDVHARGDRVRGVAFPEAAGARNDYPITVPSGAPEAELGRQFVELVRGQVGREALTAAGFQVP
ncbi:molybdate transport system substrate-binding protein [Streptoalloteichus tenebrarius]|uniref:Molybdate transport system substrate-binding protein n=1 Tax=Streptoalloteichus tenebrarius (strain ATCC 17920 / DSM 40477 / JCM 4838 / CBS 697.72 / NBRC 16177 / NCIMB 11028 / NRRL B-12390 / A12253. 1 / ISP 5477) TaxID=1933 RepID=A0ABT1HVF9_STRSD|nr:molybdate ABC transporter substrate-binding protein [Streptoalloteichus tenebrarius]MCP2259511.1 molybdate transport system substrate-binding protein [Streptoalloteichus tenebrarius]BFF01408.1 molybdate ABC transporter substrate-binding protein [Streptoalloteichus tenebrarius]